MKKLQLEIYNTLLGKQSIQEFEQWLYDQENILNELDNDLFIHNIVTLNYLLENSLLLLEEKAIKKYGEDFKTVLLTEKTCIEIDQAKTIKQYYILLEKIVWQINYENENSLLNEFHTLYNEVNRMFAGYGSNDADKLSFKIRSIVEKIVNKLENCTSVEEKKAIVFKKRILSQQESKDSTLQDSLTKEKLSLRKKIAHFFAKLAKYIKVNP